MPLINIEIGLEIWHVMKQVHDVDMIAHNLIFLVKFW